MQEIIANNLEGLLSSVNTLTTNTLEVLQESLPILFEQILTYGKFVNFSWMSVGILLVLVSSGLLLKASILRKVENGYEDESCMYFNSEFVLIDKVSRKKESFYGLPWFSDNNFKRDDIDLIKQYLGDLKVKIRKGFVSNSSSSSFIINIGDLIPWQLEGIRKHSEIGRLLGLDEWEFFWEIKENSETIEGSTDLDNFDMDFYFTNILGINPEDVIWRE